jgi:uncharacterized protein (TIGR03663 family)
MKIKPHYFFLIILFIALAFRVPGLSFRTMHGDEAVNALKFADLLEKGDYKYNPVEYHGPILYYATLPFAYAKMQLSLPDLDENTLRMVPLVFAMGLILLLLFIKERTGWQIVLYSALLLAISPFFVYYSRYYIHEMLFVFFSYGALFSAMHLYQKPDARRALLCAVFFASMMATKETWVIIVASFLIALLILLISNQELRKRFIKRITEIPLKVYITFAASFITVYVLLFSSFLKNPAGLWDSFSAISIYLDKSGSNTAHIHPWYQYFKWLTFSPGEGHIWSEGIIAILALSGFYYSFKKRDGENSKYLFLMKLLSLFTLVLTIIFSVLLYKTPWNALSFWMGIIILAGYGFYSISACIHGNRLKTFLIIAISLAVFHLGWQSYQLNFIEYENPENPYVYAHPQKDIFRILEPLQVIAENHPQKKNIHIQVIVKDNDYWPLPWYLRDFNAVGWWDSVDNDIPSADVIIAGPEMEEDLIHKFYDLTEPGQCALYVDMLPSDITLRPGRKIRVLVTLKTLDLLNL